MAENFRESLGLHPDTDQNFALLGQTDILGFEQPQSPEASVIKWGIYADPSGANTGYFVTADGSGYDIYSIRSPHHVPALLREFTPGLVEAEVVDAEGETVTKVLVGVDDPYAYDSEILFDASYRISAFSMNMQVFDSVEEWKQGQTPMEGPGGEEVYMGPGFIASPWLFQIYGDESAVEKANPLAMLNGECEAVELVTNELTGNQWYRVELNCGFPLVLGLPADTTPAPRVGSIVDGEAYLAGSTGAWYEHVE